MIGEGREEAKKRKKPYMSCRRDEALSLRTRHHLCTRKLCPQGPMSVHAHRTEGVSRSEGRERADRVGGGIGAGGVNRDANNGVGGGNGDVKVVGTGTERERERA